MTFSATRILCVSAADVRRTLVDIRALASWNPAIGAIHADHPQAIIGCPYRTRIRGVVPAVLVFDEISETAVRYRKSALGSTEYGSWAWTQRDDTATTVTHTVDHEGLFGGLMARAFEDVPGWRIDRLGIQADREGGRRP